MRIIIKGCRMKTDMAFCGSPLQYIRFPALKRKRFQHANTSSTCSRRTRSLGTFRSAH